MEEKIDFHMTSHGVYINSDVRGQLFFKPEKIMVQIDIDRANNVTGLVSLEELIKCWKR